jgi:outer membrane protein insertion porin family
MRAEYESAGGGTGGDFEFRRGIADLRRYVKLSRAHFFDLRLAGGITQEAHRAGADGELSGFDAIPVQERFYLGGVGTMRATQFKSLTGDRMVLGNAELRVQVFDDFQAVVFTDVGDAWIDDDAKLDLKVDAGVGFQDSDGSLRVNFAKKMDRGRQGDVFVSARIQRMF